MNLKITLLILLAFGVRMAMAQDKVYKKDGSVVELKAVEKTFSVLKYQMNDYPDGPVLWMSLRDIKKIEYKNGVVDDFKLGNPRLNCPLSFNIGAATAGEAVVPFFNTGYFFTQQVEGIGEFITDFQTAIIVMGGARVHLTSNHSVKKVTPYIGYLLGIETEAGLLSKASLGLNYAGIKGFNAAFGLQSIHYWDDEDPNLGLEISIGMRF